MISNRNAICPCYWKRVNKIRPLYRHPSKLKAMHDSIHRRRYGGFITLTAHLFTSTAWLVTLTDNKCTIIRAVSDLCCCVACTCEKIQQFYCFIISRTDVVVPFLKGRRDNGKIKKLISTIYCFSKTGTYPEKKGLLACARRTSSAFSLSVDPDCLLP